MEKFDRFLSNTTGRTGVQLAGASDGKLSRRYMRINDVVLVLSNFIAIPVYGISN